MIEQLRQKISPLVRAGVPLAPFTTFRIGGPAEYYFEAQRADDAILAVRTCRELRLPYYVLGGGSNLLVSDEGIKGLVIRLVNRGLVIEGDKVAVEAGTPAGFVAVKTAAAGLVGFEWAVGLPGTIGGAIRGNAGMFGGEMKDSVEAVRVLLADGQDRIMTKAECGFAYRESIFKTLSGATILSAILALQPGADPAAAQAKMRQYLADKAAKQPLDKYSAGCAFKNWKPRDPETELPIIRKTLDLNKDESIPFTKDGGIPAGWIIDRAQLKGLKVGHAAVSEKHANFIVSDGQANASEIIALTSAIKMKIRDLTEGVIELLDEIEYAGF
ncbi:MAG: UDP-N-acetylmuramate dehydrogenase [Patescibacteria group bacterium]|jgi:UDP-N-acetylmuramate dehydrogenase